MLKQSRDGALFHTEHQRHGGTMTTQRSFMGRAAKPRSEVAGGEERKKALGLLFLAVFSALMSQFIFLPLLPPSRASWD